MARFLKSQKSHIGLSPDELLFRGEKKEQEVSMSLMDFDGETLEEFVVKDVKAVSKCQNTKSITWLNINGLHDLDLMRMITEEFDLDPIIASDILNTHARPKVYEFDNCVFISLRMLRLSTDNEVVAENLVLLVKDHILISFQEVKGDVFDPVRERIRKSKKRIRNTGTDYLAFALIDVVLDNYMHLISSIGEKIEMLDERLIVGSESSIIQEINDYKGEVIYLRKAVIPCREMIFALNKLETDLFDEEIDVHLKELQDNVNLTYDSLETYREILSDQLNIYHTTVSTKLNDIMKFLTVFSVIFIPLTFIAGIYGTNFEYIPELHYKYSYFIMWGVMIALTVGMVAYFKKKKWF